MIPFWQIRNQYNVNKERQNKSKCLHLHKHMQSRAGLKHGSFVQKWTVCSLFQWASITKPERRRRETSPLRRRTKAALLFALFQHKHNSSKRRLCQVRFLLCFCTNLLYVQQQAAEESRWIIQAMSSEHLCRFCHLKKQEDNEPDGSFICDEETIKCHQNRFQIHLDRSGNLIDTAHPVVSCVFHPFQCHTPSTAAGINRIALDSSRYSRCCGLLTIDPFGLRVVSLELCLEQILHSQLGVAPSLGVNCKKTSIFFLVFSIIKHRFCRAGQFAFQHAHRWKSISGISWPWLSLLPLAFQCFPRYRSIKSQTSKQMPLGSVGIPWRH